MVLLQNRGRYRSRLRPKRRLRRVCEISHLNPMKRVWKILTSLRLTVVLLALSIVLVFVGTVAQADEGLYNAQERYFQHWIVVGISFFGHHIPLVWPGGYLLGTALLINLLAAHIQRFQWTWKKLGIHLAHIG